jgi:hypothetical protein
MLATTRAGTKEKLRALSSSGSDRKLSDRVAALSETGFDEAAGVAWIGRNARVSEPEPMVDGVDVVLSLVPLKRLWF